MPTLRCLLTAALIASAGPAAAKDPVDPAAYPELASDVLLPPIIAELKRTLNDPYSIRDFTLCPPRGIKLKDGKPVSWVVLLSFNAKNGFGGYDGVKAYSALFRGGRISGGITSTQFASSEGLEGMINNMVSRRMATCPTIPDAAIQQIVSGSILKPG